MMLPATVTQQRACRQFYCMSSRAPPRTVRTSISNRPKKRLRPARFGKNLGLSLTKKWRALVIVPISGSLRGKTRFCARLLRRFRLGTLPHALIAGAAFILIIGVCRSILGGYEQWGRKFDASWFSGGTQSLRGVVSPRPSCIHLFE
jgi:hypothetical protein